MGSGSFKPMKYRYIALLILYFEPQPPGYDLQIGDNQLLRLDSIQRPFKIIQLD